MLSQALMVLWIENQMAETLVLQIAIVIKTPVNLAKFFTHYSCSSGCNKL